MKCMTKAMLAVMAILSLALATLPAAVMVHPSSADHYPRTVWSDMGKKGSVSGRVVWAAGEDGVAGAYVAIVNASDEGRAYFSTTSDKYGDFTITGINATYSSSNRTGSDGTDGTFQESLRMYRVYANVSYANGNHSEGYSEAFGIDADSQAVTAVSVVLYARAAGLTLTAESTSVDADGEDTVTLTAYGYDALGNTLSDGTPIALSVEGRPDGTWGPDNGSLEYPGQGSYVAATSNNTGTISTVFGWVPYRAGGNNSTILAYLPDDPSINASIRVYFAPMTSSWTGYVVDSYGTGYGGIPVVLHVMGTDPGGTPYEIYNMTATTSSVQPFTGLFVFDYILSLDAAYGYVSASAPIAEDLTIYGSSNNYSMNLSRTSIGSIVLKTPLPDELRLTADRDVILVGGDTDRLVAQLYLNGLPYRRPGMVVTFSSDNDTVAALPAGRSNVTDLDGQAWTWLRSNDTAGTIHVTANAAIMYGHNLTDSCAVRVVDRGTVSGIVTDQNKVGMPNANVTLWNVRWNNTTNAWDNAGILDIPDNPQLSNDGRTAAVGMYTFYRVPWGVYKVTGEKEGHIWYAFFVLGPWPSGVDAYANASIIPSSEYGTATHNIVVSSYGEYGEHLFPTPTLMPTPVAPENTPAPKPTPGFEASLVLAAIALLRVRKAH